MQIRSAMRSSSDGAPNGDTRRGRNRSGVFALFTLSAAALAGLAALLGLWPFAGVQAVVTTIVYGDPSKAPIQAITLFPAVPPVHKVVNVYDPPPASAPYMPASGAPKPSSPSSNPGPSGEPSDGSEPGDD